MAITPDTEYLIIGAGFSGLAMAHCLLAAGEQNIRLYERAAELGGTWAANTYPGCACDVPAHVYSYSFDQKPDWSKLFANQPEILTYIRSFAARHGLERYISYGKTVTTLTFDEGAACWEVTFADGETVRARYVIAASGPLAEPALPDIPGLDGFSGALFHSARWDHALDLAGKRVAVIGTGASAIQFVPEIAGDAASLHVFQRTAPWILPRIKREFSQQELARLRRWPGLARAVRRWLYWRAEMRALGFFRHPGLLRVFEWMCRRHLKRQVADPALRAALTPAFRFGCKRLLMSNDWYPALTRDTSELVTETISRIVPTGIELTTGKTIRVDVIIAGTGFHATEPMPGIEVVGMGGRRLHREWAAEGAEAYYGAAVSGYPNLFMLLGPNTGLGHNSVVYMAEAQIEGIVKTILSAKEKGATAVNVKQSVQDAFNREIQQRLGHSVWQVGGCDSWYKTTSGKNTTIWPGYTFDFKKQASNLPISAFELTYPADAVKEPA